MPVLLGTKSGNDIHNGTPTTIYSKTQPNEKMSTIQGFL